MEVSRLDKKGNPDPDMRLIIPPDSNFTILPLDVLHFILTICFDLFYSFWESNFAKDDFLSNGYCISYIIEEDFLFNESIRHIIFFHYEYEFCGINSLYESSRIDSIGIICNDCKCLYRCTEEFGIGRDCMCCHMRYL